MQRFDSGAPPFFIVRFKESGADLAVNLNFDFDGMVAAIAMHIPFGQLKSCIHRQGLQGVRS